MLLQSSFWSWITPWFPGDILSPKCLHKCWFCLYIVPINVNFLRKYKYFLKFSVWNRIKYKVRKKCINHVILLEISTAVKQKFLEQSRVGVGVVWSAGTGQLHLRSYLGQSEIQFNLRVLIRYFPPCSPTVSNLSLGERVTFLPSLSSQSNSQTSRPLAVSRFFIP